MLARNVYICGIGGIGTSAVAKFLHAQGIRVSGSDLVDSDIISDLKALGIPVFLKQETSNVPSDIDLLVYTQAAPSTNPERLRAKELGVTQLSYPEFLGELSKTHTTVAVSGTKGKTTTTSLIALLWQAQQQDPTVFVGGMIPGWPLKNTRVGKSDWLVVEACEYRAAMLSLSVDVMVLTNMYHDHPDFYRNLDHVEEVFAQYIQQLPDQGVLIWNADDEASSRVVAKQKEWLAVHKIRLISYGKHPEATVMFSEVRVSSGKQTFVVQIEGVSSEVSLNVPGEFNVYNACAMLATGYSQKMKVSEMIEVLASFQGTWRRFEKVGEKDGALIYTDYAHTPESVFQMIEAAKAFYPDRRLLVAFQPHQYARTQKLFEGFVKAFDGADRLLLVDIYDVAGREEKRVVSSEMLAKEVKKRGVDVVYSGSVAQTEMLLKQEIRSQDLVFIMGAGDIYDLVKKLT